MCSPSDWQAFSSLGQIFDLLGDKVVIEAVGRGRTTAQQL